ncbi:MAG TPA: translation elongation factor Ts [Sphingobacteriaceae bacterium]|nr:translation elongation factor Ts [Sphingobacteriaceae bacterium]
MTISASQVKELREKTGAGMMDCKRALEEAKGDMEEAIRILREKGMAAAERKAGRRASEGLVDAYIHHGNRVGALIEVNCETDFVARTEDFRNFVRDLAMQVAAANPRWVRREDIPPEVLEQEKELLRRQALQEGKPENVVERMVEGRLNKYLSEVCLEEQPFIRDPDVTVGELVKQTVARVGENVRINRFARFELGVHEDAPEADGSDSA